MPKRDIIVVGASAGGVEALKYLVKQLPSELNAAILVVLHFPSDGTSVLPQILNRAKGLPVSHAKNGEVLVPRRIYVAPPDYHLLVKAGYITLVRGPRENSHRPAIDPLFRTAALACRERVIGVVLTGVLDDGTAGLKAVKQLGGVAVVQDPEDAMYPGMPRSAIENVDNIDYILPLAEIPNVLVNLVDMSATAEDDNDCPKGKEVPILPDIEYESNIAELDTTALGQEDKPGIASHYSCPDCGGNLWELQEADLLRFRCRIGHAFSVESLIAKQSHALEDALWVALRALEEKSSLARRMALRMRERNYNLSAERFEAEAQKAEENATLIRNVLLDDSSD